MTPFIIDPSWYEAYRYSGERSHSMTDTTSNRTADLDLRLLVAAALFFAIFAIELTVILLKAPPAETLPQTYTVT